jgi:hypothetical protein
MEGEKKQNSLPLDLGKMRFQVGKNLSPIQ